MLQYRHILKAVSRYSANLTKGNFRHAFSGAIAAVVVLCLLAVSFLPISCGKQTVTFSPEDRKAADSIVHAVHGIDSLALLQKRLESEGNRLGSVVALRVWGKQLRNESRFAEALHIHNKGRQQAEDMADTIEWVQALNNIGTDYRRMGLLDMAQKYHYQALDACKESPDTSFQAKKNRVVSLNGLGNIYMSIGNYERADSVLRLALADERRLHSAVGQAINYANLGAIFEHRGQTDSAWVYYRQSMEMNKLAGSTLGVALCHINFGSLYQKAGQYSQAIEEYKNAYNLMHGSKDEWHALNAIIALADIYQTTGNAPKAMEALAKAKQMAEGIESTEHLAQIHNLYYKHYKQAGDCRAALIAYEKATAMQDSLLNIETLNRIQNTSLNIERNRQAKQMDTARLQIEHERAKRNVGFVILGIVLLALMGILSVMLYTSRMRRRNHLALKKISQLREHFFTNITHEFRTPLTIILGLSHELQSPDATDISNKAQTIERHGKGLLKLINQLLDISKIKSSAGNPDWRNGDITAHFAMIAESWHEYARSRHIDLQFHARETIVMDFVPDYATKVVYNLLSNAFKFTPDYGKVNLLVRRDGDKLLIDVEDTGKGIDEKTLPHVFEAFYQAENDTSEIGTGVGLALVKQIMDAVHGQITVESTLGKGTKFHISVPIQNNIQRKATHETVMALTTSLPETEEALIDSEGEDGQCRLLVIEDNRDIAAFIGSLLADRYAVTYANNGDEGLEKAIDTVPDLIITDLMMPGIDGLEVCRQVRSNDIINHIPIIVVTAKITEEERIRGIEAGADAYLAKPFNATELRTRVEKLLDNRRLLQEKFAGIMQDEQEEEKPETGNTIDADKLFLIKLSTTIYKQLDRNHPIDVAFLASSVCMSPRQFQRKLNALVGLSPVAYVQRLKIRRARTLLDHHPEMMLQDVALKSGFNVYPNFVRAFKNVCGVTPTEYRSETGN